MVRKLQKELHLPTPHSLDRQKPQVISGVYFLFHGNQLVYVGQSVDVISRVHNHRVENIKKFTNFAHFECNRKMMDEIEKFYIYKFQPRYNIIHKGNDGWIFYQEDKKGVKRRNLKITIY